MNIHSHRMCTAHVMLAVAAFVALLTATTDARAQCRGDHDCKRDRVCDAGTCVDPSSAATPPDGPATNARGQCRGNQDCKGNRVCDAGACVDPTPAATSPGVPPSPTPAPPPPATTAPPTQPPSAPLNAAPPRLPGMAPPAGETYMPAEIEDWDEGEPIPPGYHPETEIRKGLVIGGASTLGALWVISIMAGAVGAENVSADTDEGTECVLEECVEAEQWYPLFVPVLGPFIAAGTLDASGAGLGILIFDGMVQAGGLAMLVAGLVAEKTVLRRDIGGVEIQLAPVAGPQAGALGVIGRF